jgi:hypothetical protein
MIDKRMKIIAEHHGIDVDQSEGWKQLAFMLALEPPIRELQVVEITPKSNGHPIVWTAFRQYRLLEAMESLLRAQRYRVENAARVVAQSADAFLSRFTGDRLKDEYYLAKKAFVRYPRLFHFYKHRLVGKNAGTLSDARLPTNRL